MATELYTNSDSPLNNLQEEQNKEINNEEDIDIIEEVEMNVKYSGYVKRQLQQIGRFKKLESKTIPDAFPYDQIPGFSQEVREKLKKVRPSSIGQASRISGVTPAAISLLLVAIEKHRAPIFPDRTTF